jgi:hypothetical protein
MAWQQRMEAIKATQVDRTAVTGMIIGIIVGLALGLLIGWVWWPVEWQGTEAVAAPPVAAGSTADGLFDTPEARYLYLGATADAYVYATAEGRSDAASVAAQRLAALGGDIRSAFDSTVLFYRAQPGGAEQVSNLTTLAAAVGITLETDAADAGATGAAAPAAGEAAAQPAGADSAAQASTAQEAGSNPLQWLVSLVAALLLIGGGLYLLWLLNRRRALEGNDAAPVAFEDEEIGTESPIVPAFDRDSLSPMRSGVTPAASMRSTVERPVAVQGTDPHGFEPEEDDDIYPPVQRADAMDDTDTDEDELLSGNGSGPGNDDEWNEMDEEEVEGDEERDAEPDDVPPVRTNVPGASVRTAPPPTLQAPTLQPPIPSRYERYTPIDSYTATYYLGQVDFDQGKPIGSPSGDGYLGEYSVGIPQKNGLLDHDLEKPIAMEVVLFDKSDGQSTLTTTRLLLSDYAHDHMYDEYQRANPNLAPIVARPNTRFQLEGKQLLLDCLIKDVKYTRDGFFQSVTLDLVVKRKS